MNWRRDIDQWFIAEVLPHAANFRAYARRLTRSDEEAEDLVQEAYARALACEDWRGIENAKSFVFRVVHNLAVSRVRRAKIVSIEHIPDLNVIGAADPAPDPYAHAAARQELALLESVIASLPTQSRQVVTLRKIYDMAPNDIAARLKISVSTVEKHLSKGMRLIAEAMSDSPPPELEIKRTPWARKSTHGDKQ